MKKSDKKTKEARTRWALIELINPEKLPSEGELKNLMNMAIDAAGYDISCVTRLVYVKDQCLTLNVDLCDACAAIVEEHDHHMNQHE